jgi:nitroreductase
MYIIKDTSGPRGDFPLGKLLRLVAAAPLGSSMQSWRLRRIMGYGEAISDLDWRLGNQDSIPIEPSELIAAAEAEGSVVDDVVVEINGGKVLCGNFDSSFLFIDSSEPSMEKVAREFSDVEWLNDSPFR